MTEKNQNCLQKLLAVVLAVAMVFTGSLGTIGAEKVYADEAICKVTVTVKDKVTGDVIEDARVIFTDYNRNSSTNTYPVKEGITRNDDGSYNLLGDSEWGSPYRYYAEADGYYDSRTADSAGVLRGAELTIWEETPLDLVVQLEPYPEDNRLQDAITNAQNEINGYVNKADYDPAEQDQIDAIIAKYLNKISEEVDTEATDSVDAQIEILNAIVEEAKAELDEVHTSQNNANEEYADDIYFETVNGRTISLVREEYGKYKIELSRYNNEGIFKIKGNDADTSVNWNATQEMYSISAGSQYVPFEVIDNKYDKGVFLNDRAFPQDVDYKANVKNIEDCSVTYTKEGKTVTVTFDLVISDKSVEELVGELDKALAEKENAENQITEAVNAKENAEADLEDAEAALEDAEAALDEANDKIGELEAANKALQDQLKEAQEKGHHVLIKVEAKAPTCTTDGNNEYYTCAHCDKIFADTALTETTVEAQTIEKTGHTFNEVVTKATTSSDGKIEKKCSECGEVESTTTIKKPSTFTLSATTYTYDGNAKKPTVTVKDSAGKTLVKDTDYTLTYANGRKNVGKYSVKVTFKGKYSGTKTLYFTINPPKTSLASLTSVSKGFTAKWNKKTTQVTGYQIQYSTSSKFTNSKTVTITSNSTTSKKITNLTAKKKYYVKVRTYKTVGTTKYYSSWSGYKYVTTK
ncbi:MAG: fibronectin type III domain-containing protein [Eubacteriaceae bacterium]|nr:fibronectin type III domain-containing protein [Eubacteriaceae bacterium]